VDTAVPQGSPAETILFVTYVSGIFDEVEALVLGIRGLYFVDDIGWWADRLNVEAVAAKLSEAALAVPTNPAAGNGAASDNDKTEAPISRRGKTPRRPVGEGVEGDRWKSQWKIRDLLADGRCSQATLDFLSAMDVRKQRPAPEDAETQESKWELRERREREQ